MGKMREEFESEMRSAGMFENGSVAMERCQESGGYADPDTNAMWHGFIAGWVRSRAALRVKLPVNCKGMALTVDEFRAQLDKEGIGHE